MQIQLRPIVLLLFVALSASGWGRVMATSLCAHGGGTQNAPEQSEDHSCCPDGHAKQESHCHTESNNAVGVNQVAHQKHKSVGVVTSDESFVRAIAPCGHCLTRSVPAPAYTLRESSQSRKAADTRPIAASQSHHAHQTTFVLPVISRQGAPPGTSARSHVLLNIFLL